MKTEIQEYMEARISEIRNQNTMFDIAVTAAESFFERTFDASSPTQYSLVFNCRGDDVYVIISLDETSGITNLAFNYSVGGGEWVRYATVTITSSGAVNEMYDNVPNSSMREDVFKLATTVYSSTGKIKGVDKNESEQTAGSPET